MRKLWGRPMDGMLASPSCWLQREGGGGETWAKIAAAEKLAWATWDHLRSSLPDFPTRTWGCNLH